MELSHLFNGPKLLSEWAQSPGIGAEGADAGGGVWGRSPSHPPRHSKGTGAQVP